MTTKMKAKRKAVARRPAAAAQRPSANMNERRPPALTGSTHVTRAGGNVFADLGFPAEEAENLKMRARFMGELRRRIAGMTQAEAAERLHVSQSRVGDLTRGKIGLFTIDALVNMLAHAGVKLRVSLSRGQLLSSLSRQPGAAPDRRLWLRRLATESVSPESTPSRRCVLAINDSTPSFRGNGRRPISPACAVTSRSSPSRSARR